MISSNYIDQHNAPLYLEWREFDRVRCSCLLGPAMTRQSHAWGCLSIPETRTGVRTILRSTPRLLHRSYPELLGLRFRHGKPAAR